jgi:hypothetical protein
VTSACVADDGFTIPEQVVSAPLPITETSAESVCVIDSTYCINKGMQCPKCEYVRHFSEDVRDSVDKH